ncbi:MAG: hypothetical protein AAF367_19105 [Pseudomonadota bacterium]
MSAATRDHDTTSVLSAGAISLLRDCVHGYPGERLLIVEEPKGTGYYDDEAQQMAAAAGRALGMRVYETEAPDCLGNAEEVSAFIDTLKGFDHIVFFTRIGDQLRFSEIPGMPPSTMCYALDREMLDSAFGAACHHGMCELKAAIDDTFAAASEARVTCPSGTDYAGDPSTFAANSIDVSLKRFPMLVPRPVPAAGFRGRIALTRFLVGTGSRFYEPYSLPLSGTVYAFVEDNQIVGFDGAEAEMVRRHYHDVGDRFGLDPWFVHSWHAGMHPGCGFAAEAESQITRWSGSAFGNPRVLHFHTCGDFAPGEISMNIFDPTITLDGVAVWEDGCLRPERMENCARILASHPRLSELFRTPRRDIGIPDGCAWKA